MTLPLFVSAFGCPGLPDHRFRAGLPKIRDYRAVWNITKKIKVILKGFHVQSGFVSVFLPDGPSLERESDYKFEDL